MGSEDFLKYVQYITKVVGFTLASAVLKMAFKFMDVVGISIVVPGLLCVLLVSMCDIVKYRIIDTEMYNIEILFIYEGKHTVKHVGMKTSHWNYCHNCSTQLQRIIRLDRISNHAQGNVV